MSPCLYGIGVDLVTVARIGATHQRFGERFVKRLLGEAEQIQYHARLASHPPRALRYLATRYAAKEALFKALGTGLRAPLRWNACQVLNDALGKPVFTFEAALAQWLAPRCATVHLSLTDEGGTAIAYVVVEAHPNSSIDPV